MAFNTVRGIRSAMGFHLCLASLLRGESLIYDRSKRLLEHKGRWTDSHMATTFAKGLGHRLGTDVVPSHALLSRHVKWNDNHSRSRYNAATEDNQRLKWALAGLANVTFWLGWLRSRECFDLRWCDVT